MLLRQPFHEILEHKVGVALAHSSEILAVLVGEAVQDQGCEFVHPLRVVIFRVVLQVNEDYAGQPIFVGQFLALLSSEWQMVGPKPIDQIFQIRAILFLEEVAVPPRPFRIFLNLHPQLLVFEIVLPFWLLGEVQRMVLFGCLRLLFVRFPPQAGRLAEFLLDWRNYIVSDPHAVLEQIFLHWGDPFLLQVIGEVPQINLPQQRA